MQSIRQHSGGIFYRWFLRPLWIIWKDGRRFDIDRVVQVERAASRKAGGVALRYTVMIGGKRHHLYYEDNFKWFVEAKTSV